MAARQRRRAFGVVLVVLVLGAVVALVVSDRDPDDTSSAEPAPTTAPEPDLANPLVQGASRNPSVLQAADGTYYAYVDGIDLWGPLHVVALTSTDLATWTMAGDVVADPGAWADPSSGSRFTSPSVRYVRTNPPASRYVMYLTGPTADGSATCIGVAIAAAPEGPFVGADRPLICPPGGARAASPVPGSDQVVYRAEWPTPGVYGLTLDAGGTAVAPGARPSLLLGVAQGVLHEGVLERPAVARDADGAPYLFARTGGVDDGVSWSPCRTAGAELVTCADRLAFGSWLTQTAEVRAIGGLQVFTDADGASWIAYDAQPATACTGGTCTGLPTLRIDRLCFAHGVPRTDGPTTGPRSTARSTDCSIDVPGAPLRVVWMDDSERLGQPSGVSYRDTGSSVPLGGRLLWLFRDSYIDPSVPACWGQGASRSNGAGLGLPHPLAGDRGYSSPLGLVGPGGGCTGQFVPLTDDEHFFNYAQSDRGLRVVLWVYGGIPLEDGSALVFFVNGVQNRDADGDDTGPDPGCPFCFTYRGQGVVRVEPGQTVADRASTAVSCAPTCLFGPEDTSWTGWPFLADGYVYAYSATPETRAIRLGRVPVADVLDRSAWTFRTEDGEWSTSITDAAATRGMTTVPTTVAYNAHLDQYVAVVKGGSDVVAIRTAPEPWGPWGDPTPLYDWSDLECDTVDETGRVVGIDAIEAFGVPWLDDGGGRVVHVAFSRPGPDFGRDPACPGEVRLVSVALA